MVETTHDSHSRSGHEKSGPEDLLRGEGESRERNETETSSSALAGEPAGHEKSVSLREKALLVREEAVEERESDLHRREELLASERGMSFAHRVQEISDAQLAKAVQEVHHSRLRQANESLVIASVQSHILTGEINKSNVEATHLANHYFLTNLPNRIQLYDCITEAIAYAKQHHEKLAVLFLDLDRFKSINDTLGHAVGDQLLQAVAQRLQNVIPVFDIISRQGGDEFVLMLSGVNREATLVLNVEQIHALVTAPYLIAGHDLLVGAAIGISIFPRDGADTETLIRNAGDAMYHAKKNGRNKHQFFGEISTTHVAND